MCLNLRQIRSVTGKPFSTLSRRSAEFSWDDGAGVAPGVRRVGRVRAGGSELRPGGNRSGLRPTRSDRRGVSTATTAFDLEVRRRRVLLRPAGRSSHGPPGQVLRPAGCRRAGASFGWSRGACGRGCRSASYWPRLARVRSGPSRSSSGSWCPSHRASKSGSPSTTGCSRCREVDGPTSRRT